MRPSNPFCNDNFVLKHRFLWETANGPIPKGHKVIFADGDKTNITLDNLIMVSSMGISPCDEPSGAQSRHRMRG